MSARLLRCMLLFVVLLPVASVSGAVPQDEVLILVQAGQAADACRVSPSPVTAYQRLSEGYLMGVSRDALKVLQRAGVAYRVIDERPWGASYAVVTHGNPAIRTLPASLPAQILHREGDAALVKGHASTLELMRASGYQVVQVTGEPVPVDESVTHLPPLGDLAADDSIRAIIQMVSDSSIYNYILGLQNFGTRYWNNANRDTVARWIRGKFLATGMTDAKIDSFTYSSGTHFNVVATTMGNVNDQAEIIVGGHHDATSSNTSLAPGADDNASGTVAALEMARVLRAVNYRPNLTLRFMTFGVEEAGLVGSNSYATRARNANRDIRAMLNYDMIANRTQTSTDRDVYVVWYTGSEALSNLNSAMMRAYTTLNPIQTTSYRSGSDSYSFSNRNYKSTFVIERDFSPYYHTPNDLLQYLDMAYAREVVQSGLAMLLTLDKMPPAVAGLRVRDRGDGVSLLVTWDSVEAMDLSQYRVRVGVAPGVYTNTYNTGVKSMLVGGLTSGTRHYVGVSMVDQVALEGMITEVSGVPRLVPLSPAGLTATSVPRAVSLKWRKNQEVDLRGYHLYRRNGTSGAFARITANALTDTLRLDSAAAGTYQYYSTAIDSAGNESTPSDTVAGTVATGIGGGTEEVAYEYRLDQNYPNPFNPMTQIPFEVATKGRVRLSVFDVLGREVAVLVDGEMEPGRHTAAWDASGRSTGVYFATYNAGGRVFTAKMALVR